MKFPGAELRRKRLELGIAVGRCDELRERPFKIIRKADKTIDWNAVRAVFILLRLLESQVEVCGDIALAFAGGAAGNADITPQLCGRNALRAALWVFRSWCESSVSYLTI
jgi:hypothetical protein